ncbi:MAG TPA: SufE family protein [Arachidicoccus sp.]
MEIDNIQDRIIDEFEEYSDKSHRFKYFRRLVQIGSELAPIKATEMNKENLVVGGKSKIWLKARLENGKVFFTAHSKNLISKGLVGLLLKVFSGRSPKEIINSNLYFLNEINLYDRLNPEWLKDLLSVMQKIKSLAIGLQVNTSA